MIASAGTRIEALQDDAGFEPGHAHDAHGLGGRNRLQHGDHRGVVDHTMLQVDGQRMPPLVGHDLPSERPNILAKCKKP